MKTGFLFEMERKSANKMNVIIHHWQKNKFELADGSPIPPPPATLHTLKWMPGDVVSSSGSCGTVIKRTCGRVVGIIDVLNRTRFGTTARGVPLYIMYPIDVTYPPFLVALKTKPVGNILAVARYEHWEGIWPRAGLEKQIGLVGDLKSELDAMIQTLPPAAATATAAVDDTTKHACVDWDVVLHIDPPGCKDVDDVLCWKHRDNGIQFSIGIADVAHWIEEGSELDKIAFERGATLYRDGEAIQPMLPAVISESLASLRCDGCDGDSRPAVCLTFDLVRCEDGSGWQCADRAGRWELHMLHVNESYTYDSIHSNSERAYQVRQYLSAVCGGAELGLDSHEWIERAMILYNRRVGEELQKAGVGLLRTHAGTTNEEYTTLAMTTGCREIGWLGSAAGTYVEPCNNTGHSGLSLACYTHASSPLRRYVDLLNQRWIRALFFGFHPPRATAVRAHEYNVRSKRIRRLERDMYFLSHVLTSRGDLPSASGYVLEIKKSHGGMELWRVYVPDWKRVVSCGFVCGLEDHDDVKKGMCVNVRMYLDTRQGDWSRRFVYQALKQST